MGDDVDRRSFLKTSGAAGASVGLGLHSLATTTAIPNTAAVAPTIQATAAASAGTFPFVEVSAHTVLQNQLTAEAGLVLATPAVGAGTSAAAATTGLANTITKMEALDNDPLGPRGWWDEASQSYQVRKDFINPGLDATKHAKHVLDQGGTVSEALDTFDTTLHRNSLAKKVQETHNRGKDTPTDKRDPALLSQLLDDKRLTITETHNTPLRHSYRITFDTGPIVMKQIGKYKHQTTPKRLVSHQQARKELDPLFKTLTTFRVEDYMGDQYIPGSKKMILTRFGPEINVINPPEEVEKPLNEHLSAPSMETLIPK